MKLTKLEHACTILEVNNQKLVIDPGQFTKNLPDYAHIVAVVITHNHFDHVSLPLIEAILRANPEAQIVGPSDLNKALAGHRFASVQEGDTQTVGPFTLRFYGSKHAPIHASMSPMPHNVGVLINDLLYYPGDSFTVPDKPVNVLLTPVSGPWLKIGEVIDFLDTVRPKVCVPVHDGLFSDIAHRLTEENWLNQVCQKHTIAYKRLGIAQSTQL